ncbi:hypothetical protein Tamer19_08400 [Cupriavidus sp. TA19]|nr:hypothetical protein Tamer19_08400 [Cupriavidus sp. TA19]
MASSPNHPAGRVSGGAPRHPTAQADGCRDFSPYAPTLPKAAGTTYLITKSDEQMQLNVAGW